MASAGVACALSVGTVAAAIGGAEPAAACGTEAFLGTVCAFAFNWCPQDYLPADGRTLSIQQNQALYALIGLSYGGDGKTTFMLPDLRARGAVGAGQLDGIGDPVQFAGKVGQPSATLRPGQVPLPQHSHSATFTGTGGGTQPVSVPADPGSLGVDARLTARQVQGQIAASDGSYLGQGGTSGSTLAPIYVPSATPGAEARLGGLDVRLAGSPGHGAFTIQVPTGITGGTVAVDNSAPPTATQPVPTQSPALGMMFCIAVSGLYPQRP